MKKRSPYLVQSYNDPFEGMVRNSDYTSVYQDKSIPKFNVPVIEDGKTSFGKSFNKSFK